MPRLLLGFNVHDSEPYEIGDEPWQHTIDDVIEREAENVLSEAGSDVLEEPTDECYDALRERVIEEARNALREPGDTYKDPIGVTWTLYEKEQ